MNIFLDFDSTLVNFVDVWVDLINEKTEDKIHLDDLDLFHHPILAKHHWLFLEYPIYDHITPFEGAVDFVEYVNANYDLTILTHTFSKNGERDKEAFIKDHFGDLKTVQTTEPKWLWSKNGWLIDDGIHNIEGQLKNSFGEAVLFNHHDRYNYVPKDRKHERLHYASKYAEVIEILSASV